MDELVKEARRLARARDRGTTHYTGCWMHHPRCLTYALADALEAAHAAIDWHRSEFSAATDIIERDKSFQEWAQGYLDSARWAGHDRSDAIKTELLERDAQVDGLKHAVADATAALEAALRREAQLRSLAKQAANAWACVAMSKRDLNVIGRLHLDIDAVPAPGGDPTP